MSLGWCAVILGLALWGCSPRGPKCPPGSVARAGGCTSPIRTHEEEQRDARCKSDQECAERMQDRCPGGSSALATCDRGMCEFQSCSSPIGTPCDGDPSTVFEGEVCNGRPQ